MNIESLRYALTLAEELHFGRAAQIHYIGAQPFGRHIQQLERDLGVTLFARTSRRVELTADGARFIPRARRVLGELDDLMLASQAGQSDSVLRVGVLGFGLADRWAAARHFLARHHPQLTVSYVEIDWANQYDAVRTGEVDVAILHDLGGADDLRVEAVMTTDRYAVVPVESDLADAVRLTAADVRDRPSITPVGQPGLTEWGSTQTRFGGAQVRSPANIPAAVATTGMLGVYAEPARRYLPHPGVRYIPLEGPHAVVGIASGKRDNRDMVASFRAAVFASGAVNEIVEVGSSD
ncbi:LysR substrate-binding domain-containing protein [Rhodococcus sp. USK13]|uniref:LysR family transcriptional regulator n=1 Tax=Rhodococcus sp. USK13 TaxID=2806442 RepID=UPI001BD01398|nr:LysR substrate-binding domain-containing protein [Rhodococcus sp. USK13]